MRKFILKIVSILILGAIGGLLFQVLILPYLFVNPYFEKFEFIKILKEREIIVNPKEEIIIQENTALKEAIEKVQGLAIGIQTKTKRNKVLEGSGLILTSDGLAVTLAEIVPNNSTFSFFVDKEKVSGRVLKRNLRENLALIKLEKKNLPTQGFADLERIKMGERVFLVGVIFDKQGNPQKIINEGVIKNFGKDFIKTNIFEKKILKGSPLFDIEGNILGINTIDSEGKVIAIPISQIKTFAGF